MNSKIEQVKQIFARHNQKVLHLGIPSVQYEAVAQEIDKIYSTEVSGNSAHLAISRERLTKTIEKFLKDFDNESHEYPITFLADAILKLIPDSTIPDNRPKIVCLCGSTRFVDTFNDWRKRLTYEGNIVLSIEIVTSQSGKDDPQFVNTEQKKMLDELHLRKIDLADEVLILNVGGYIGESTKRELEYARQHNKQIRFLEN